MPRTEVTGPDTTRFAHAVDTAAPTTGEEASVHLTLGISYADWEFTVGWLRQTLLSRLGATELAVPEKPCLWDRRDEVAFHKPT